LRPNVGLMVSPSSVGRSPGGMSSSVSLVSSRRLFSLARRCRSRVPRIRDAVRRLSEPSLIPGGQGVLENQRQPHVRDETGIAAPESEPMRNEDAERQAMPVPPVRGRRRCRMHGGAQGSGAPSGERNGNYRHGLYTAEAIAERKAVRAWLRSMRTANID
jgi:hypothetical protein